MLFRRSEKASAATEMRHGLTLLPNEFGGDATNHHSESPPVEYGMPVDIVAVHGLNGHPSETWTHTPENKMEKKTFWLKDLLYRDLPKNVRVFTFGYDASVFGTSSTSTIRDIANRLAENLDTRPSGPTGVVPRIIFIGHSLGGLIIKKTIILAKANENFQKFYNSIHGVIFLGTPHDGAKVANYAATLLKVIGPVTKSNKGFLVALKKGSEELRSLTEDFRGFSSTHIQAISVCEKKKTGTVGIVVVPEESATLNWGNHKERVLSFDCDHRELARFAKCDSNYRILARRIGDMVEEAAKGIQLNEAERSKLMEKLDDKYEERKTTVVEARCPNTCEWLLEDESTFKTWVMGNTSQNIWLSGGVGSGKSTLMGFFLSTLPQHLYKRTFYYFFDPKPQSRLPTTALKSILHQIVTWEEHACRKALDILETEPATPHGNLEKLGTAIREVLASLRIPLVYLVIDGIDELAAQSSSNMSEVSDKALGDFLKIILKIHKSLAPGCQIKCLLSGRPHVLGKVMDLWPKEVGQEIHHVFDIPMEKVRNDVSYFVDVEYGKLAENHPVIFQRDLILLETIKARVKEKAGSNFLVAALSMKMLEDPRNLETLDKLQKVIETVGSSMEELTEAYKGLLDSILSEEHEKAKRLFKWLSVVNSKEGFTVHETNSILAFRDDLQEHGDFKRYLIIEGREEVSIKRMGASLIRVSMEGTVGWFHISAQEHLCHEKDTDPELTEPTKDWIEGWSFTKTEAQLEVALKCLHFLLLPDLQDPGPLGLRCQVPIIGEELDASRSSGESPSQNPLEKEVEELQKNHPLLKYISKFWAYHVLECEDTIMTHHWHLIRQLTENLTGLRMAARLSWYNKSVKHRGQYPSEPTWIELFTYFGLTKFTKQLLEEREVRAQDFQLTGTGFTALQLAAMNGHTDLVNHLLEEKLFSLEDERSPTSVELSLEFGHHETIKAFVNNFGISIDKLGPLAFENAIECGSKDLIDFLVEKGEDINCKLPKHGSVMEAAAVCGNEEIADHIRSLGAIVNGKHAGSQYGHPLAAAAYLGRDSFITKLVQKWNGDINMERGIYSTALEAAATKKRIQTIQLLIGFGAKTELVKLEENKDIIAEAEKALVRLQNENEVEEVVPESSGRVSRPAWMKNIASSRTGSGKPKSTTPSMRAAKDRLVGTMRRIQIAILTGSDFGIEVLFPIPLAALELAVRFNSRLMLNHFADVGMDILYTALHYENFTALDLLTKVLWIKALRIPITLRKPELIEIMLKRCLSHFITLIKTNAKKAVELVTCGIEMFLAITEDGEPTLMETMAILWVKTFETVLDDKSEYFFFREQLIAQIHAYVKRFFGHFQQKEFHPMSVIARTALLALIHALGNKCYMAVIRLVSIYLPALEEILQPNTDTNRYEIRWLSEVTSEVALEMMQDEKTFDIIRRLIHVGSRLYHAILDPAAPREMRAEANRIYYYASAVLINAFAQALRASQECLLEIRRQALAIAREDIEKGTGGYVKHGELKGAYCKLMEEGIKEIDRRYKGQLKEEELLVFAAARGTLEYLKAEFTELQVPVCTS